MEHCTLNITSEISKTLTVGFGYIIIQTLHKFGIMGYYKDICIGNIAEVNTDDGEKVVEFSRVSENTWRAYKFSGYTKYFPNGLADFVCNSSLDHILKRLSKRKGISIIDNR